jgi:hypothetical protein
MTGDVESLLGGTGAAARGDAGGIPDTAAGSNEREKKNANHDANT